MSLAQDSQSIYDESCTVYAMTLLMHLLYFTIGENVDFDSTTQIITIPALSNSSEIFIALMTDNVIEGDEIFTMKLDVPDAFDSGAFTVANGIIVDTSSESSYIA